VSAAFDGSGYRQRVLAVLRARSPLRLDDPYFVADLDPESGYSDADVQTRLARVLAFLQRERSSAKYATLASELVRRRAEWEAPLRDAEIRERTRQRVVEARRDGDAERLAKVDGYLATVRERFGGVPASRIDGLRRLAAQAGVTGERFDARLARERLIDDAVGAGVAPLPADARGQIRDRLDELRALRRGDHASTASLWAFLGVSPDAPPARVAAAYEAVAAVNARRPHDREKTVTADLLALVRARLLDSDPAAYTAGLLADAAEELRGAVEEHVLLDGEITAVAFEGLMRRALGAGRGLSAAQVRSVVLGLARDLGVPVSTGATVDFVVCPGCGRPEPVGEVRVCRYCDTDLYIVCPTCGRLTESAAVVCRQCGHSVRQSRDASEALAAIRRALDDGRPAEAVELVARARPVLAAVGAPAVAAGDELAARAAGALAAADAGWRALADDRGAGRAEAALERARWLVAQAADVPGPDGRGAADVLEELTMAQAMIRRRVDAALALPPAAREAALVAVLASASDSPEALAALAALPLAPPVDLLALPAAGASGPAGALLLRWRTADAATPVSFRVDRVVAGTLGAPPARFTLGTTTATELTDAGAPAWTPVYYEVIAVSGSRYSAVARTTPVVISRDVEGLRAQQTAEGVRLSWRLEGPVQLVTVERAVEAVEPVDPMEALDDEAAGSATGGMALPAGDARDVDRSVRHTRVSGGALTDPDVQPGVTYRYRLSVEYVEADGSPARTPGVETSVTVAPRPRPVLDLSVAFVGGETMLRWTAPPGSDVRIYATSGVLPDTAGPVGGRYPTPPSPPPGPFGQENADLPLGAATGPARLVGASRRGRLLDAAAAGPVIYTPVSVLGGRGVVGRPVQHVAPGGVTELRAEDRGDELVLYFRLAPGLTEARVLWRRDRMPTGPDDPDASAATVTIAGLALRGGGWRLAAPRDGWPYYVSCFPVFRVHGQPRAAAAGAELLARAPAMAPPAAPLGTGPIAVPAPAGHVASYLTPLPPGPPTGAMPMPTGAMPMPAGAQPMPTSAQPMPTSAQPMPTGALHLPTGALPMPAPVGAALPAPPPAATPPVTPAPDHVMPPPSPAPGALPLPGALPSPVAAAGMASPAGPGGSPYPPLGPYVPVPPAGAPSLPPHPPRRPHPAAPAAAASPVPAPAGAAGGPTAGPPPAGLAPFVGPPAGGPSVGVPEPGMSGTPSPGVPTGPRGPFVPGGPLPPMVNPPTSAAGLPVQPWPDSPARTGPGPALPFPPGADGWSGWGGQPSAPAGPPATPPGLPAPPQGPPSLQPGTAATPLGQPATPPGLPMASPGLPAEAPGLPVGPPGMPSAGPPGQPAGPPGQPVGQAAASAVLPPWTPATPSSANGQGGHLPALGEPGWPAPAPDRAPASAARSRWTLPAMQVSLFAPEHPDDGFGDGAAMPERGYQDHLAVSPPDEVIDPLTVAPVAGGSTGESDDDLAAAGLDEDAEDDLADEPPDGSGEPWVAYSVARAGWRRRVLRIRVRSGGDVPELVLVARPGTTPPTDLAEGQALARLAASAERATRTMEVRLDGALLPWGIRVLPVTAEADGPVLMEHPADDALVIR